MSIGSITALIIAITGLVTAIGTLVSHIQLRRKVSSQANDQLR